MDISSWAITADANSSIDAINIAENCPYSNLNNMGRAIMANIRAELMSQTATVTAQTLTTISGIGKVQPIVGIGATVEGFATAVTGMERNLNVLGGFLAKNSASLQIDGGANYTAVTGDTLSMRSLGGGVWRMRPEPVSGLPVVNPPTNIGKHLLPVSAAGITPATTSGAKSNLTETTNNKVNYNSVDFDGSAQEFGLFQIAMPSSWDEGVITYEVDWTYNATATGTGVSFALQGLALSDNDAIDTAYGTGVTVTDTLLGSGQKHTTAESATVTVGGSPAPGDMVLFRLARNPSDAADTMTSDAQVLGVRVFINTDALTDTA